MKISLSASNVFNVLPVGIYLFGKWPSVEVDLLPSKFKKLLSYTNIGDLYKDLKDGTLELPEDLVSIISDKLRDDTATNKKINVCVGQKSSYFFSLSEPTKLSGAKFNLLVRNIDKPGILVVNI